MTQALKQLIANVRMIGGRVVEPQTHDEPIVLHVPAEHEELAVGMILEFRTKTGETRDIEVDGKMRA